MIATAFIEDRSKDADAGNPLHFFSERLALELSIGHCFGDCPGVGLTFHHGAKRFFDQVLIGCEGNDLVVIADRDLDIGHLRFKSRKLLPYLVVVSYRQGVVHPPFDCRSQYLPLVVYLLSYHFVLALYTERNHCAHDQKDHQGESGKRSYPHVLSEKQAYPHRSISFFAGIIQ
jgi:hypothetical protein